MPNRGRPTEYREEYAEQAVNLMACAITEIHLGIAMARAAGVVCGSPQNIRLVRGQE